MLDSKRYGVRLSESSDDLQDMGERCGEQRLYRLMKSDGLRSQTGYRRKPRHLSGKPASVLDLFSRQIVSWSMQSRMDKELVINALLMAIWKRKPNQSVMVHSEQDSQFSSFEWQ
jgi:putative transposase